MSASLSMPATSSLVSTEVVPTSTGRPEVCMRSISVSTAFHLPPVTRKTTSLLSSRSTGLFVGTICTCTGVSPMAAEPKCARRPRGPAAHLDGHGVDVGELVDLGARGAAHAGELGVRPEEVLVAHARQRHRLVLDARALLGLDGLVQAVAPAAAGHGAARELVDDDDLVVLDDVVDLALEEVLGLDGVDDEARPLLARVVQVRHPQHVLRHLVPAHGHLVCHARCTVYAFRR